MHPYGVKRKSQLTCKYGCCGYKENRNAKHTNGVKRAGKASRKRARRIGKIDANRTGE